MKREEICQMKTPALITLSRRILWVLACTAMMIGCVAVEKQTHPAAFVAPAHHPERFTGKAEILQSWQGDYPVAQLNLLPEKQRAQAVGVISDTLTFEAVWAAFKPREALPVIDFKSNLVLFARNIRFYNRISIGQVKVTSGVAEVIAMETMSAMPIEDKVAMSLVLFLRQGITAIRTGNEDIPMER